PEDRAHPRRGPGTPGANRQESASDQKMAHRSALRRPSQTATQKITAARNAGLNRTGQFSSRGGPFLIARGKPHSPARFARWRWLSSGVNTPLGMINGQFYAVLAYRDYGRERRRK